MEEEEQEDNEDISGYLRYEEEMDYFARLEEESENILANEEPIPDPAIEAERVENNEERQLNVIEPVDTRLRIPIRLLICFLMLVLIFYVSARENEEKTYIQEPNPCDDAEFDRTIAMLEELLAEEKEKQSKRIERKKRCEEQFFMYCEQGIPNIKRCHELAECVQRNS